jgi:HSP20 family molecular chaperone IbpA
MELLICREVSKQIMKMLSISLAMLAIGLLAGIAATKYHDWHAGVVEWSSHSATSKTAPDPALPDANTGDPFAEMSRMQELMDRMMNQSIEQFRNDPKLADTPGYSLALDVREFKDRFEVHAALPDAKASDVNVKLEDDRTLSVEVGNKSTSTGQQGSASTTTAEWGQYTQTVELPAGVQANRMKVDQKGHELIVILPKA